MTTAEAAKKLSVTAYTVRDWIKNGQIRAYKIGAKWHVPESVVDHIEKYGLPPRGQNYTN